MLNFDAFKTYVKENILEYLPDDFATAEVKVEKVTKANTERYGLIVRRKEDYVTPNVYLESFYSDYKDGKELKNIMPDIATTYMHATVSHGFSEETVNAYKAWETAKDKVIFDLVGGEQNKEFNEKRPNRDFMDLSIIYRIVITNDERGLASTIVTNDLMKEYGITEEDLYNAAFENTRNIYTPKVASLNEVLGPMIGEDLPECPLFFVSNDVNIHGATMMLYDDVLQNLADRVLGPLYDEGDKRELIIFPSSRHEFLAIDANASEELDLNFCQAMVEEINLNCVALEDRLSNNIYHYDAINHELTLASDAPNRRLDGEEKTMDRAI